MSEPQRAEAARVELDRLGMKFFLDVRATARQMLSTMPGPARAAFAVSSTERMLRVDEERPPRQHPAYLAVWRPVVDAVWAGLAGGTQAVRTVAGAVADCYVSPEFWDRRHDDPADADDHAAMAALYAAECYLHGCLDFATWTGWRGFDRVALVAAVDRDWPHRRPADISGYAWELAHPAVQAELDRQLVDLELLGLDADELLGPSAAGRVMLERLRAG